MKRRASFLAIVILPVSLGLASLGAWSISASRTHPKDFAFRPSLTLSPVVSSTPRSISRPKPPSSTVLDKALPLSSRRERLYRLTQDRSPEALAELSSIVTAPIEGGSANKKEVEFRITALEAIDHAARSGAKVQDVLENVIDSPDPTLSFLARISLEGILEGRPGKLTRFIDRTFTEMADSK